MSLKQQLNDDLKTALLAGDKQLATTLRGLKSAILYEEVDKGLRDQGLADDAIIVLLSKEAKKRQESADLYVQGGDQDRAKAELTEKQIIEKYLPQQLSDEDLTTLVDQVIQELGATGPQTLGQVIGLVKQKAAGQAEGSRIAAMVKTRLEKGGA